MTQIIATQVGPYSIRANCINPETILTERNQQRIPDEQKQALLDMHPIKRLGTPEDVARAALFLASDDAAWITDIIVDVAGGSVLVEKENERINGRRTESLMISRLETQHKYLASLLPGQFVSRTRKEI